MIRAENVTKFYGAKQALGPVSFEIQDGETVGFLGLNGAGKTTALRIFACDLRPSSGAVHIGDVDAVASPHEVKKRVGFLPENPPLYIDMTVSDYLDFAGRIRGMSGAEVTARMPKVLELTDLGNVRGDIIATLSHGYRQRVGAAQAIMHQPQLLILDEPTRGLDPVQIVEMRNMIKNLKENHTVLISSHILTEISETCDRLLVLGQGRILAAGTEEMLSKGLEKDMANIASYHLIVSVVARGDKPVADVIAAVEGVKDSKVTGEEEGAQILEVGSTVDVRAALNRALVAAGHDVIKLQSTSRELENIFLRLVQGDTHARN